MNGKLLFSVVISLQSIEKTGIKPLFILPVTHTSIPDFFYKHNSYDALNESI